MIALKSARTLAASLGVLAFSAMAATPAMAFDDVDWDWYTDVKENIDIDVDVDIDVNPTGLVQVEKLQIFLGNVNAESKVHDINNVQYDRDQYFDSKFFADGEAIPALGYHGIPLEFIFCLCKGDNCDVDELAFDATIDLPSVISAATAVGNNQSITSDVPVFLHDGQFVANTLDNYYDYDTLKAAMPASLSGGNGGYNAGNLHTDLAVLFTLASGFGLLTPAEISASSTVYNINNATVDSTATAVANNLSVTLESNVTGEPAASAGLKTTSVPCVWNCGPGGGGNHDTAIISNHVVIADITQFAYANVSAVSNVCDVELNEYTNLAPDVLGRPIVNSVATAVGNNVSITVGVPTVEAP
ncbi:MAG: hypothetical protein JNL06_07425 [Alphaproteobacteria bacterium]|nr:hypothetical protein [Alphaproteobacteria bacterium]